MGWLMAMFDLLVISNEDVDVYDILQSKEDKATVPIYYEARRAKVMRQFAAPCPGIRHTDWFLHNGSRGRSPHPARQ